MPRKLGIRFLYTLNSVTFSLDTSDLRRRLIMTLTLIHLSKEMVITGIKNHKVDKNFGMIPIIFVLSSLYLGEAARKPVMNHCRCWY